MPPELYDLIYSVLLPLAWAVINGVAIAASRLLWKKTRTKGPLLLFVGSLGSLLIQLAQVVFLLFRRSHLFSILAIESVQLFYLATAFSGVVCHALVVLGAYLIAKEFRSLLELHEFSPLNHPQRDSAQFIKQ